MPLVLPVVALIPALVSGGDPLRAAYARGDLDEIHRLGRALGAGGLAPLLNDELAPAAILAASAAADGWELLPDLARLAGSWDRQIAAPAAHAAVRIARRLDADAAVIGEISDDDLATSAAAWRALARRGDRWADVRVHALEVTALVAQTRRVTSDVEPGVGYDVAAMTHDGDPEVRRAACELAPQPLPAELRPVLASVVAHDSDAAVAVAAAQALCADLGFGDAPVGPPLPALSASPRSPQATTGPVPAVLAALGPPGLVRLRAVLADPPDGVPAPALVDAARCLRADAAGESRAALRALAARAPRDARTPLARLMR